MRIALVTETFPPFNGGSSRRYFEVFRRLVKKGHEVDVFTVRLNESWSKFEEIDGLRVFRTDMVLRNFITSDGFRSISQVLLYTSWAWKRLGNERYDIIEANHCPIFPTFSSWYHSRVNHIPLSVTFHEVWFDHWYHYVPSSIYAPLGMIMEKAMSRLPSLYIAVSRFTADKLEKLLHIDNRKIVIIPNGVNLDMFNGVDVKKDRNKIIYFGRLNPHKRVDLLLEAMKIVIEDYPDVKLEIVGDGPMRRFYEEYTLKNGLKDHVSYIGNVSDLELVIKLKSSYIYVLPSIREGQSITTLEAMAAGTPQVVVMSDDSGASQLLHESKSGIIVRASALSIAEGIKMLLDDRNSWLKFRDNGLKYVKNYTWDFAAEEYNRAYTSLVNYMA
ncbi:MAG: glycosyltransferase family 4 protein [Thermoprotei archaeon]